MSLWGKSDQANQSPIFTASQLSVTPNTANRDKLYANSTANTLGDGRTLGVFGVSQYEKSGTGTGVASVTVDSAGAGYTFVPNVSFSTGNATANAYMGLVGLTITHGGNNYAANDNLSVNNSGGTAAVNAVINVVSTEIRSAALANSISFGSGYSNGDIVALATGTGNAATFTVTTFAANSSVTSVAVASSGRYTVNPTTTNVATTNTTGSGTGLRLTVVTKIREVEIKTVGKYTVLPTAVADNPVVNTTGVGVSGNITLSFGVASVNVTSNGSGFSNVPTVAFTGNSTNHTADATAHAVLNSGAGGAAHTGWVLRTEGTGGRAGRVQYEVLVAGGIANDAGTDDTIFPGA